MPPYLLVIESDPDLQQRIGDTLRQAHYELSAETDAAWAKRSLLVRPPDGVILDTRLSDGSGFVVAEELRRDPDTRTVPIFFVASGYRDRKSTRLNSSHSQISYAVFCLKKKKPQ